MEAVRLDPGALVAADLAFLGEHNAPTAQRVRCAIVAYLWALAWVEAHGTYPSLNDWATYRPTALDDA